MVACMLLLMAASGALGLFLLRWSGRAGMLLLRCRRWPGVLGRVVHAELVRVAVGGNVSWRAEVAVDYEVGGRAYTTRTLHPLERGVDELSGPRTQAVAMLRRFQPGERAAVTYNPADPADAVLVPEGWGMVAGMGITGAAFVVAAVAIPFILVFLLRHGTVTT